MMEGGAIILHVVVIILFELCTLSKLILYHILYRKKKTIIQKQYPRSDQISLKMFKSEATATPTGSNFLHLLPSQAVIFCYLGLLILLMEI